MKCPHCHHEIDLPPREQRPYCYHGYLKDHLPLILAGLRSGKSPMSITIMLRTLRRFEPYESPTETIRYIGRRYGLIQIAEPRKYKMMGKARAEHAWLLRAEGLTLREIGERIGLSHERVRQMIRKFGRDTSRSLRITKWKIETDQAKGEMI